MTSTRLPGKVLEDVGGEPMLNLVLARLARAVTLDSITVATSTDPSDDPIAQLCTRIGIHVHRGSLRDVLSRFAGAITDPSDIVVRVTADCPLIDPASVDEVVHTLKRTPHAVYSSNIEPRTFPDGLDVEAVRAAALLEINREVDSAELREHVTLAIRRDAHRWPRVAVTHDPDLGHLSWTVDTEADLAFVRAVVARLGSSRYEAGLDEILAAVKRPPSLSAQGLRG